MADPQRQGSGSGSGRSSSSSSDSDNGGLGMHPEQYQSPLSAQDMVALATTLQATRPSLRAACKLERGSGQVFNKERMGKVEGAVRAACPNLAPACATGVALALLPLCAQSHYTPGHLLVQHEPPRTGADDDGDTETAVAAFFAALEHPSCAVTSLTIVGGAAAFGTPAAAARLGGCLGRNATVKWLTLLVDGFCAAPVWAAFSDALASPNATLEHLRLEGGSYRPGDGARVSALLADARKLAALRDVSVGNWLDDQPTRATVEDMRGWGAMLRRNSAITRLTLNVTLQQGGGLLVPLCGALLANTGLQELTVKCWKSGAHTTSAPPGADDVKGAGDADANALATMLRTNRTLTSLNIGSSGIVCNGHVVHHGLKRNRTLRALGITMDAAGARDLMAALQLAPTTTSAAPANNYGPQLKSLQSGYSLLEPGGKPQGFPTAAALGDMIAANGTLTKLDLWDAPYSNLEWATTILPALAFNGCLQHLGLRGCPGVDGGLVYDTLVHLLESDARITSIDLSDTPLHREGKAQAVEAMVKTNQQYGAALETVPTALTTSCRLVLCGHEWAGKSTLLQTLASRHSSPAANSSGNTDAEVRGRTRTRGIDIQPLHLVDDLTVWVWDFSGRKEFRPLQDFIFPNGSSVHAATLFVFTFNPFISPSPTSSGGGGGSTGGGSQQQLRLKEKDQFEQEFGEWLRFICSNSAQQPSSGVVKPTVLVVITHKDRVEVNEKERLKSLFKGWVGDVAAEFKDRIIVDEHHPYFVDANDKDDSEVAGFEGEAIKLLRARISEVHKVPVGCDVVAEAWAGHTGDEPFEHIVSFSDLRKLCKSAVEASPEQQHLNGLKRLLSRTEDKACRVIAAYLRDAGEVLYFSGLDFVIRDPRWFAHGILGYLIDPQGHEPPTADDFKKSRQPSSKKNVPYGDGLVGTGFFAQVLQAAGSITGVNNAGTSTDQLIALMRGLDLCYKVDGKYVIPTLFKDKDGKVERGECKRRWQQLATTAGCIFVTCRLEVSDPLRTFLTPGFFPRLQAVLKNLADQWDDVGKCTYTLEKGFCRLVVNGMEILLEHSGSSNYFLDIMVKSSRPRQDTLSFLQAKIISEIRRLCASPRGYKGVTLVEAIIRPDCVGEDITLFCFRQSVQVASLEQQMMSISNFKHYWPAVTDDQGRVVLPAALDNPQHLLDGVREADLSLSGGGGQPVQGHCMDTLCGCMPCFRGKPVSLAKVDARHACYPNSNVRKGMKRGVAVIISMEKYSTDTGKRSGGSSDRTKLSTLVGSLGFREQIVLDRKAAELRKELEEIADRSVSTEDECFLCVVMGHGGTAEDGAHFIVDHNEEKIKAEDITRPFMACEWLNGKPKVFFVISGHGSNGPVVHSQLPRNGVQPSSHWNAGNEIRYLQDSTDCLMVFSTSAESVSTRYPGYDTSFVCALVTNLNDKRQTMDVLGILNCASQAIAAAERKAKDVVGDVTGVRQYPIVVHSLTKLLDWSTQ